MFRGAVSLDVFFYLPRPKYLLTPSKAHAFIHHTVKPDSSKLVRCVEDALIGVLWLDDSQITDIQAHKRYCYAAEDPRTVVTVRELAAPEGALFSEAS
jgi:Holliday junction resolvase RusA-like endonuclease